MSAQCSRGGARADVLIDRATRIVRLLAWIAMFAICCLMLWTLGARAAQAQDPKAAARELGQAGLAEAGAIAKDAASTVGVPGYAGTDLPERHLAAAGMADAANARLADPDDAGGNAGRVVVEGAASRPDAEVAAGDPAVVRGKGIAAAPEAPAHGADGVASGYVTECGAVLADAQSGGGCGGVAWCVGADCDSVGGRANTGFVEATARLNMATELGGEEFDREKLEFFKGDRKACTIRWGGLANCSAEEQELADERNAGNTHYLGKYCAKRTFFGFCIRRARAWCVFGSKLGRILQQQGRGQLGIGWGSCRGFTVAEIESIDFERLDLTEFTENLLDGVQEPAVTLPESGDTQSLMRTRIREFTKKGAKEMRAAFSKTILVVDEGSLASTVQARDLLRIANELRIPRVVLVGDAKQLDAVDAGKPFAQLQAAGMKTATMDEIMRQRDPALKGAVEASLKGEIGKAFEKLGSNVAEVKPDNIAGAVAARWLRLSPEARESTGVMAPSHELRQAINGHIRERLAREGRLHGPSMETERLVSKGYTNAEKALAGNYAKGDVVAFHRPYKRLGVEKGDERRVVGVDHKANAVRLEGKDGGTVAWKPAEVGGRKGGSEVYRSEGIELRAGDRIRWTRNDDGLGLVNSRTAEVEAVTNGRVTFQLEDGRRLELGRGDLQLRHLDHAWASTVHAFQGRTVDNVIAAMEARHPHLTTQKSFYVEISRARDRAELVTDDAAELRAQLQAVAGERIAALEGIGEMEREARDKGAERVAAERTPGDGIGTDAGKEGDGTSPSRDEREPALAERDRGVGRDLGL